MAAPAGAQQAGADAFAAKKADAVARFLHGEVRPAATLQQALIAAAPTPYDKALLQRDLMEMCAAAQDWACVARTIGELLPAVKADPRLASLQYDIVAYGAKLALWRQDSADVATLLRQGGALAAPDPSVNPAAVAELELALHDYDVRNDDLKSAENSLSVAIEALLMTDGYGKYRQAELAVGVLQALLHAQDIVGAIALANTLQPLMLKLVPADSVVAARYAMLYAHVSAFTENYPLTARSFENAARLVAQLDIEPDSRTHDLAVANSLAAAALILDNRAADALEVHKVNPLQASKDAILARGDFATTQEFYFAVSDLFISAAAKVTPDMRWKPLLEKPSHWHFTGIEAVDADSYRNFALGILAASAADAPEAGRLLRLAARQRIDNIDTALRANFEGFPLPSLMDWIVIGFGLDVASRSDTPDDLDLTLRGSEALGRSVRHALVDTAVLLGAQPDTATRRAAQAYVHLLRQKRDWEIEQIGELLARDAPWPDRPKLIGEYKAMVGELAGLKDALLDNRKLAPASGLPSLLDLQHAIPSGSAFVTYYATPGGMAKLCITRDTAVHAVAPMTASATAELKTHTRLIAFATTATYPADPRRDAQYPVAAAIDLDRFYFGGLEACLRPGTHVTVAPPRNFAAAVPFGALLAEAPPRIGDGYDLAKAHWLIRDLSFSRVVSARQYLAAMPYLARAPAPRPYLGVGDPRLDTPRVAQLASVSHGALAAPGSLADFDDLPDTADELKAVGALFGATDRDIMLGEDATEAKFRARALSDYDVIHFATHGLIKQDIAGLDESALVLTPSGADDASDDGLLTASEISSLALDARLVVLSACNTAKYDIAQATLGVHDLQAAFTAAGTPTLLASLWPVESNTARVLVTDFFAAWRARETAGAADALSRATRAYLATADAAHQHPRFWAPFVVVGNGEVRGVAGAN